MTYRATVPQISTAHYRKMKNSYRHEVAKFLADRASQGKLTTYGELSAEFGGVPRGWGDALGGIAIRCHEAKLPILSVTVVNASTQRPSPDAVLYEDLGLRTELDIESEQNRALQFDWYQSPLLKR